MGPRDTPPATKPLLSASPSSSSQIAGKKRRRNRWSDAPPPQATLSEDERAIASAMASFSEEAPAAPQGMAHQCLTPDQLQQMEEQIEVKILSFLQFSITWFRILLLLILKKKMNKLVARIRAVTQASTAPRKKKDPSKPQYEYDSDEDTEGGTWEHKKRNKEMMATYS